MFVPQQPDLVIFDGCFACDPVTLLEGPHPGLGLAVGRNDVREFLRRVTPAVEDRDADHARLGMEQEFQLAEAVFEFRPSTDRLVFLALADDHSVAEFLDLDPVFVRVPGRARPEVGMRRQRLGVLDAAPFGFTHHRDGWRGRTCLCLHLFVHRRCSDERKYRDDGEEGGEADVFCHGVYLLGGLHGCQPVQIVVRRLAVPLAPCLRILFVCFQPSVQKLF